MGRLADMGWILEMSKFEQISILPMVMSDEDAEELKRQAEQFAEYAKAKRKWENAFQKWSNEQFIGDGINLWLLRIWLNVRLVYRQFLRQTLRKGIKRYVQRETDTDRLHEL